MTLGEWHRFMVKQLGSIYSAGEAKGIIRILFENVFNIDSVEFFLRSKTEVDTATQTKLEQLLKRLLQHEPVQYVTGKAHFYGLTFKVNPAVLIPRPETEELVKWVLADLNTDLNVKDPTILDIGTGSGCIAIAIKKNHPASTVFALDISQKALEVAKENAAMNDVEVNLIKTDILNINITNTKERYDIIVSNPPYITKSEQSKMATNVLNFEPHIALFVEDGDALLFYKAISNYAAATLNPNGRLYFEINESQGSDVKHLLQASAFRDSIIKKDLNGKERMVRCSAPLS